MAQQRGSATTILIAKELTFKGTPSTSQVLPYVSESVRYNRNLLTSKTIRSGRNAIKPVRGAVDVAGDIAIELAPEHGKLLHQIFGSYSAQSGSPGGVHTFTIGDLPSFVMEKQFGDLTPDAYYKYTGCKVNTFKFTAKAEGFIDATLGVLGCQETVGAASFETGSATDLGITPFDGFGCSIKQGNVALGVATQIDFTIENNVDGNSYVIDGTGERKYLPEGRVKVSGTLTALFEDNVLYELAKANTETSLEITLQNGTGDGTAGNEKLVITMPEMIFKPQAPVVTGPAGVLVELPFEAYYQDDVGASTAKAVLTSPTLWYD